MDQKTDLSPSPNRVVSSKSHCFRKDILQFSKIGDECITLSACDFQISINDKVDNSKTDVNSFEKSDKKVDQTRDTFEKVISTVKKTDGFLKVACRKCDTFVTDFRKLKDVISKTITFGGLRAEVTRFG